MKITALPLFATLGLFAGCGKPAATETPKTPPAAVAPAPADKPQVRGVIQDILADRSSLVIKHEEIPGVMRAMTMAFRVDAATLQAAQKGQTITGEFESSGMNFTLANAKLGPAPTPSPTAATSPQPASSTAPTPPPTPAAAMPASPAPAVSPAPVATVAVPPPVAPAAATPAPASPEVLTAGAAVYNRICIACHLPTGTGIPAVFPPLAGSSIVDGDARRLIRIVLSGLQGPIQVNGLTYNNIMPGHAPTLNDAEVAAVLSYIRNSWGHTASAVAAPAVATERAANRTTPWTWAELTATAP